MSNLESNPFCGLFSTVNEAETFSQKTNTTEKDKYKDNEESERQNDSNKAKCINNFVESVFLFTVNKFCISPNIVYLDSLASSSSSLLIDTDMLGSAIFERLILKDPENHVLNKTISDTRHALEKGVVTYLFYCFQSLKESESDNPKINNIDCDLTSTIKKLIFTNASTCLQQPDIFPTQEIDMQIVHIFYEGSPLVNDFFTGIVQECFEGSNQTDAFNEIGELFTKVLKTVHREIAQSKLFDFKDSSLNLIKFFCKNLYLAKIFILYNRQSSNLGKSYSDTLLGSLFSLSCLPKTQNGVYEYYDSPLKELTSSVDTSVWNSVSPIIGHLYEIFYALIKCSPEVQDLILSWVANCIHTNAGRGKLWNTYGIVVGGSQFVSDGFMINFSAMLLRLCRPFCSDQQKVLLIDPTYCAVPDDCDNVEFHHAKSLSGETCLMPVKEGVPRLAATRFKFVTECFFLTHKALDIGFRVAYERLMRLNQDIAQLQRVLHDVESANSDVFQSISERMESEMTKYLSLRGALLEPSTLNLLAQFHITTALWLVQVAFDVAKKSPNATSYCPVMIIEVEDIPPDTVVPATLQCVPEFIVENIACFLTFVRRFSPSTLEEQGFKFLNPMLTMVLVFMGSQERMRNPHLRARMAECLESLLPHHKEEQPEMNPNPFGCHHRERLFQEHPLRHHIVPTLLDVFVSIEMTGQSVAFEQKFNYRRPMYIIMDYLWNIGEHQDCFIRLAKEAEKNMDAIVPPIFLRFINLLMNDAVFLLDEALSNMAQLRTMETQREAGEWANLPAAEREQNENNFHHIGMIARFDNILGKETIYTLKRLTSKIKSIFSHPTMADRIAAMLNYFLLHLVGPKKRNFKVKDRQEYEFQPAGIVSDICKIYIHLGESDKFCAAVSQDGRSYSSDLFSLAENVLIRIGEASLTPELRNVAEKVAQLATEKHKEDEILAEAPDEFLDPIMSTVMIDPVILPSSRTVVDRSTIARHLLSDQSDPFNRSPLTMDMVQPHTELKLRIEEWINKKKEENKN